MRPKRLKTNYAKNITHCTGKKQRTFSYAKPKNKTTPPKPTQESRPALASTSISFKNQHTTTVNQTQLTKHCQNLQKTISCIELNNDKLQWNHKPQASKLYDLWKTNKKHDAPCAERDSFAHWGPTRYKLTACAWLYKNTYSQKQARCKPKRFHSNVAHNAA